MFYTEIHEVSDHWDQSSHHLHTTRTASSVPPFLKPVWWVLFCFRCVFWLRLYKKYCQCFRKKKENKH